MKKSENAAFLLSSVLLYQFITVLSYLRRLELGDGSQKDYLIFSVYYFFQWTCLPIVLLILIMSMKNRLSINKIIRYKKLRIIYSRILLEIFSVSIISGGLNVLSGLITGRFLLGLPKDNWNEKGSYVMNTYGIEHADISLLKLSLIICISVCFIVYVLACICLIIYRITASYVLGFLVSVVLITMELERNGRTSFILSRGSLNLSIYVVNFNIGEFLIYILSVMALLTLIILFMGHGDFLKKRYFE